MTTTYDDKTTTAPRLLLDAVDLLSERGADYDKGEERSMGKAVKAFNTITGHALSETQGWQFMQILKLVRSCTAKTVHADSYRDGIAYSALAAEAALSRVETDAMDKERESSLHRIAELEHDKSELEWAVQMYEAELLDINHVCIRNFTDHSGQKLSVALEECIAELKAQIPKTVKPIRVSRGTSRTGFPSLAWTCPECGCRKQVGTPERDDTPIGDVFCTCGVKLDWERA